jgi:hypothetical protein
MKHNFILILSFSTLLLFSCKKIAEKTQFDMDFTQTITIQSSTGVNLPFNIMSPDIETNSESTFAINDTRKDLIEEILLNSLDLKLTSPPNGDFSFLESISIFLSAEGIGETKIAWMDEVPNSTSNTLSLNITQSDLKEFIKKDEFELRVNTVTDEILTSNHTIDVLSSFHVDAEILGQ